MKSLLISGSPIKDSSTEILLTRIADGIDLVRAQSGLAPTGREFIRLNELKFIPCQACGKSPEPAWCFFEDDLTPLYEKLVQSDAILLGTPVYFDSVSGQMKMFIDRCNCFRPPDYAGDSAHAFKKRGLPRRIGAGVLVGGVRGEFELARRVLAAFFKWLDIDVAGYVRYESKDFRKQGEVLTNQKAIAEAHVLGQEVGKRTSPSPA